MDPLNKVYTEYFSKWRGTWVTFDTPPTTGQINQLIKFNYRLR
jgi:hypothetical protein